MFSGSRVVVVARRCCGVVATSRASSSSSRTMMMMRSLSAPKQRTYQLLQSYHGSSVITARHLSTSPPVFLDVAEVTERIMSVVKNFDQVDKTKVTPETKFAEDLGLDSLDIVEIVMAIEDEFAIEIPDQEADKISTIADAISYISTHPMAK